MQMKNNGASQSERIQRHTAGGQSACSILTAWESNITLQPLNRFSPPFQGTCVLCHRCHVLCISLRPFTIPVQCLVCAWRWARRLMHSFGRASALQFTLRLTLPLVTFWYTRLTPFQNARTGYVRSFSNNVLHTFFFFFLLHIVTLRRPRLSTV